MYKQFSLLCIGLHFKGRNYGTCHSLGMTRLIIFKDPVNNMYVNDLESGIFFVFLPFLGPLPQHMEVPRLGVESEL